MQNPRSDADGRVHEVSDAPHSPHGEVSQGHYVITPGGNLVLKPHTGNPLKRGFRYATEAEIASWAIDHPAPPEEDDAGDDDADHDDA